MDIVGENGVSAIIDWVISWGYKKLIASWWWLLVVHSPSACKGRGSLDAQLEFILATKMKVYFYNENYNSLLNIAWCDIIDRG